MQIEGKNKLVKLHYKIEDIAQCMVDVFNRYWRTCEEIAPPLRGVNEYDTCKNVWQYVIDHTQYKEDDLGTQFVKSPARLLHDRIGDCKSMAVLTASLLSCLGIDCKFRYVTYQKNSSAHHVFVMTKTGLVVDPVEWFQKGHNFNEQTKYIFKMDKPLKAGLAVLSGMDDDNGVAMDGSVCTDNTYALNYLYAALDNAITRAKYNPTAENIDAVNFFYEAKELYKKSRTDSRKMRRAGRVLQAMDNSDAFSNDIEQVQRIADKHLAASTELADGNVAKWWDEMVVAWDYQAHPDDADEVLAGVNSGAVITPDNLPDRIKDTGVWFLYGDLSDKNLQKYSRKMPNLRRKAMGQRLIKQGSRVAFMGMNINSATYDELTQSGLMTATKGKTADQWMTEVMSGNATPSVSGGGLGAAKEVIILIVEVVSLAIAVASLILAIKQFAFQKDTLTKYYDTSKSDDILAAAEKYGDYQMEEDDFPIKDEEKSESGVPIILLLALGFFLLK